METLKVTKEIEIKNAIKLSDNRYLKIFQDSHYQPMDDVRHNYLTIIYSSGSNYTLGDKASNHNSILDYFKDVYGYTPNEAKENVIWLPVYAYVHSGATIATDLSKIPNCRFDSFQSGFVYTTKEKIRKARDIKRVTKDIVSEETKYLEGHVETFDDMLQGKVYGFNVVDENDEEIESCWGFIGDLSGDNGLNMANHIDIEGVTDEQIYEVIKHIADEDLIIY
jgi:hypothetical protein